VISLVIVFWMYVILFAVIGAMRGWAKEILVTFGIVLSLFLITVLETYVGVVITTIAASGGRPQFWLRTTILILLVFFSYQTPNIRGIAGARFARERLQDTLLGFMLGGVNGFLVVGTIWFFLYEANYPFPIIIPPQPGQPYFEAAERMVRILPPEWLTIPWIYFAVGLAFLFVIIVFI
jgi:hypothetical protein